MARNDSRPWFHPSCISIIFGLFSKDWPLSKSVYELFIYILSEKVEIEY